MILYKNSIVADADKKEYSIKQDSLSQAQYDSNLLFVSPLPTEHTNIKLSDVNFHNDISDSERDNDDEFCVELPLIAEYTKDYILENVKLSVKNGNDPNIVSLHFLDLSFFLRIDIDKENYYTITWDTLKRLNISELEVFTCAMDNTREDFILQDLHQLNQQLGMTCPVDFPAYIVYSKVGKYGAAILHYPDLLGRFCNFLNIARCFIIPLSVNEIILIPDTEVPEMQLINRTGDALMYSDIPEKYKMPAHIYYFDLDHKKVYF